MTPDEREKQREAYRAKNAARKAGKSASNREARALRKAYGGSFGTEEFNPDSGVGELIKKGTRA